MIDYPELYRRLWQLVQDQDAKLSAGAAALVAALVQQIKPGEAQIPAEAQAILMAYFTQVETGLRSGIQAAARLGSPAPMRDEVVARQAETAFTERWADGKTLSDRLWRFQSDTRQGIQQVLQASVRAGRSASGVIYDMQRQIEAQGTRFEIANTAIEDWATALTEAGSAAIHDPAARKDWDSMVRLVRGHIDKLADTGTRHAAEVAFRKIKGAVAAGNEKLLGDALHWWVYDKQLYLLKRISRTEMATAQHRAVIATTLDDPDIIGYQWRLSSSHPRPDICDYYANIDQGLGKGVWRKEEVPRHKAHPHCMCLLIPRVTRIKQAGALNYAEFIQNASPERRRLLLPQWAQTALGKGVGLPELIRPDGFGLISKAQAAAIFPILVPQPG